MGLMRWSPRTIIPQKKLTVSLTLCKLHGIQPAHVEDYDAILVDVKWKGPKSAISYLRKSVKREQTVLKPPGNNIIWNEDFYNECILTPVAKSGSQKGVISYHPWDVHFVVKKVNEDAKEKSVKTMGTLSIDLASFLPSNGQSSSFTKTFPITLTHNGLESLGSLSLSCFLSLELLETQALASDTTTPSLLRAASVGTNVYNSVRTPSPPPLLEKSSSSEDEEDLVSDVVVYESETSEKKSKKKITQSSSLGRRSFSNLLSKVSKSSEGVEEASGKPNSLLKGLPGEDTEEEEDLSSDDSLKYRRIAEVSGTAGPLASPPSMGAFQEHLIDLPIEDRKSLGGSIRFLGLSFGSSSASTKPTPSDVLSPLEPEVTSDTEEGQEVSGKAAGLQIKVAGHASSGFWGASQGGGGGGGGKRKLAIRSPKVMEEPLLNKAYGEDGGDEIDWDRRQAEEAELEHPLQIQRTMPKEDCTVSEELLDSVFGEAFSVGRWENREITSRDTTAKMRTDLFFASIDQCHARADGDGACTALVALLAEWLHAHPGSMPNRAEFDAIIKDGSAEWRRLCGVEEYRTNFPDKHFDLETVLESRGGRLNVVQCRSYVGFFRPHGLKEVRKEGGDEVESSLGFLEGAMSFEEIWKEVEGAGPGVYILSWNDHFFLLVVESQDCCYIVDTLGRRLYEGCRQAYMLRFNNKSSMCILENQAKAGEVSGTSSGKASCAPHSAPFVVEEESFVKEMGKLSCDTRDCEAEKQKTAIGLCGEFVKRFFAAVPLRELERDLAKGLLGSSILHKRLQVELHFTQVGNSSSLTQ